MYVAEPVIVPRSLGSACASDCNVPNKSDAAYVMIATPPRKVVSANPTNSGLCDNVIE